jgi:LmbE family N-acetylglucosaminyl deacetylase
MNFKNILILAPHPDDAEFSAGGTLHRLISEGSTIWYAVFSPCNKSLPEGMEKDHLYNEMEKAASQIGIDEQNIIKYKFPVRDFPEYRQDILEELIKLKKSISPDLVFIPNSNDVHQDHNVMYKEGLRAFKTTRVLGYELPWNNLVSVNNYFISLQKENLDAKISAIEEYKSQNFRGYKDTDYFYCLAKTRGIQANTEFAEAFELIKWIY